MSKLSGLKLLALVLCCGQLWLTAEEAEDRSPRKELAPDEEATVKELKELIAKEKERLKKFSAPIDEIKEKLKKPSEKISEISGHRGEVSRIIDSVTGKKMSDDQKKSLEKAASALNGAYAKAALEVAELSSKTKNAGKDKALQAAQKKLQEIEKKIVAPYERQIADLEDKKATLESTLESESSRLNGARAKLDAINGYGVAEGMGAQLFESETSSGGDGDAMRWLDAEIRFIDFLNSNGYEDLAEKHLAKIEKGNNPFTGQPFSTNLRSYLSKANARVLQQKSVYETDMVKKMLQMKEVIKLYAEVQGRVTPMTPLYYDASNDLIHAYFYLAGDLYENASAKAMAVGSKYTPAKITCFEGEAAPASNTKKAKAPEAKAPELEITKESLEKLDEVALNDTAFALADKFYQDGMKIAMPLSEKVSEIFGDMIDEYSSANEEGNKGVAAKKLKTIERMSPYKLRLQHSIEDAFAKWPNLYPVNSEQRKKILETGKEFFETNLDDYANFWPGDKAVYNALMEFFGMTPDPMFDKDEEGKPLPRGYVSPSKEELKDMSKQDQLAEKRNLERYPWATSKIAMLFNTHIIGGEKKKGKTEAKNWIQTARVRGLYAYAQALVNSVKTHTAMAEVDSGNKDAWQKHADKLHAEALEVLEDFNNDSSKYIGTIEPAARYSFLMKVAIPYYLYCANRSVKGGKSDEAVEYAQNIMTAAAAMVSADDPVTKLNGARALAMVQDFGKKNNIEVGGTDPEEMPLPLLASSAEKLYREAGKLKEDEAMAKYRECRDLYLIALDKARTLTGKSARDRFFPKAYNNMAMLSVRLKDYDTAYVVSQLLVQEFRNDFKNPALNYPPEEFPNTKKYFPNSLDNLRASALLRLRENNNPSTKRDYIDALLLCVRYSNKNEDYLILLNAYKQMGKFAEAAEFIDGVDEKNAYYRLAQLMGAGIYLDWAKKNTSAIKKIDAQLNPPLDEDGKPAVKVSLTEEKKKELQNKRAKLEAEIVTARKQASAYAKKFITLHTAAAAEWKKENESDVSEFIKGLRADEKKMLLTAHYIPIMVAHTSRDWDGVVKQVPEFMKVLESQTEVEPEEKESFKKNATWAVFDSTDKRVDYAQVPLKEGAEKLAELENTAKELEKISDELGEKAAAVIGARWSRLAFRADKDGNKADADKYRLKSVNWMEKAEDHIYDRLDVAVQMLGTLAGQKLWERAVNVGNKAISFWGESMFTDNSLVQKDKKLSDLKDKGMSAIVKGDLGGVFKNSEIADASGDPKKLVEVLNSMISKTDCAAQAEAYKKAVDSCLSVNNHPMKKKLEQVKGILEALGTPDEKTALMLKNRKYLEKVEFAEDLRNQVNRTMLEVAYPEVLFARTYMPVIPTPAMFYKMLDLPLYRTSDGQDKALVLKAMIDPKMLASEADKILGEGGKLAEWKEKAAAEDTPDAEKKKLQRLISALEKPLVVSLYGEPDPRAKKGRAKIINRSYPRARAVIATMLEYDKDHPTTDFEGKFPMKETLEDLALALTTQDKILRAKKNYAKAMVEYGAYENAEKYVLQLCALFPSDWSLQLELARVYNAMAGHVNKNTDKDGKPELAERPYTADGPDSPAALYKKALSQAIKVFRSVPSGSETWWDADLMMLRTQVEAIEGRKKAGGAMLQMIKVPNVVFVDPVTGRPGKPQEIVIKPLDNYDDPRDEGEEVKRQLFGDGVAAATAVQRDLMSVDPVPSDEAREELEDFAKRLEAVGYAVKIKDAEPAAEETAKPAAENKDVPAKAEEKDTEKKAESEPEKKADDAEKK